MYIFKTVIVHVHACTLFMLCIVQCISSVQSLHCMSYLFSHFQDSYLQNYFSDMNAYLHIGPPVYFVIKEGFNYTDVHQQNKICTGADCEEMSYGTIITIASRISNQ